MSVWKKNEPEPQEAAVAPVTTPAVGRVTPRSGGVAAVGPSITIEGNVVGEEDLLIDGKVAGKVTLRNHSLTVGKSGRLKAEIVAKSIIVEGEVEGDLVGQEEITIRPSGKVRGNIRAPRVTLESGCRFKGSIDMEAKEAPAARSADKPAKAPAKAASGSAAPQPAAKEKSDVAVASKGEPRDRGGVGELPLKPAPRS